MALAFFFGSTVKAAYQDAASLIDQANMSSERWRSVIVSAPHSSFHAASIGLPFGAADLDTDTPVGVRMGDPVTGDTVILSPEDPTGSIGRRADGRKGGPDIVRTSKGDLLMSRTGVGGRITVDEDGGLLKMPPRILFESPMPDLPRTSFMKPRPMPYGDRIQLASLDTDHIVIRQPTLTTPLEAVERRGIDRRQYARDLHCMATAIYFEARSEPEAGQRAVAQVVVNRVRDHRYPDTVCDVVYQNKHRRNACQFSFACDGKPERIRDQRSWATAMSFAEDAMIGDAFLDEIGGSTHYHADYVRPRWARALQKMDRIGRHIFFKLYPGQT